MKATFKALADETRRNLLDELYMNNGQTLTQLCGRFDMSRQAVTKHLSQDAPPEDPWRLTWTPFGAGPCRADGAAGDWAY